MVDLGEIAAELAPFGMAGCLEGNAGELTVGMGAVYRLRFYFVHIGYVKLYQMISFGGKFIYQ